MMSRLRNVGLAVLACLSLVGAMSIAHANAVSTNEDSPQGSAMDVGDKLVSTRDYFEHLLGASESELVRLLSAENSADNLLVEAIQRQQKTWLQYRNDECGLIGLLSGAGGSWPSTYAVECQANLTDQRYHRFRWAIKCWKDIAPADRKFSGARCLYQLAPLATK